ncbi:MAG TPA: lmo0937 family membrane protein [Gemmatimonadaceae bacterium]|nr:lmo0937 family membrane protein [Gemmatimonadaceae bacterium]
MLTTMVLVLLVLWALGLIGGYTMGGLIHLLVVAAIIVLVLRFLTGRRVA